MKMKAMFRGFCLLSLFFLLPGVLPSWGAKVENPARPEIGARYVASPLLVVGTYDDQERANFGLFDRGGIVTSKPQTHISIAVRRTSYTHRNLMERKAATLNIPSVANLAEADLFGSVSGMKDGKFLDKLAASRLTAEKGKAVNAPLLREFPISLECELVELESLDPGSAFDLAILKVVKAWVEEGYVNDRQAVNPKPSGLPEIAFLIPGRSDGNTGYYGLGDFLGDGHSVGQSYREKIPAATP